MQSSRPPGRQLVTPFGGATKHPGLSFQVGEWVRLKNEVNDQFKAGMLVKIYNIEPAPHSDHKYPGQSTEWLRTDADTLYRFLKKDWVSDVEPLETAADGPLSIPHAALALIPRGRPARQEYAIGTMVYTTQEITVKVGRELRRVGPGIRGRVIAYTTRNSGPRKPNDPPPADLGMSRYTLRIGLRHEQVIETKCSLKPGANAFERVSEREQKAHAAQFTAPPPAPEVVSLPSNL